MYYTYKFEQLTLAINFLQRAQSIQNFRIPVSFQFSSFFPNFYDAISVQICVNDIYATKITLFLPEFIWKLSSFFFCRS